MVRASLLCTYLFVLFLSLIQQQGESSSLTIMNNSVLSLHGVCWREYQNKKYITQLNEVCSDDAYERI